LFLVKSDPVVFSVVSSAAFVFNWKSSIRRTVVGVSVVKSAWKGRPESVVLLVESILHQKRILCKLQVALEEFPLAGALSVRGLEHSTSTGVFPDVLFELPDALVAVLFADALLAVFVGLAFVVKTVLWSSLSHFRKRSVSEQVAVASIGPVLALVEFVPASVSGELPDLPGNLYEIGVSSLRSHASVVVAGVWATCSGKTVASDFYAIGVAHIISGDRINLILSADGDVGGEKGEKFHFLKIDF